MDAGERDMIAHELLGVFAMLGDIDEERGLRLVRDLGIYADKGDVGGLDPYTASLYKPLSVWMDHCTLKDIHDILAEMERRILAMSPKPKTYLANPYN